MAHKTLVGGTAYNVVSGTSIVSGATYNIVGGKTLVSGTGYDINFEPVKTAMLYDDGSFVFQDGDDVAYGKSLVGSYTGFEDVSSPPWNGAQSSFTSVNFDTEVAPTSMVDWFNGATDMVVNTYNFRNLNMNHVTNMSGAYYFCTNLTGSPVCGNNVINISEAYMVCTNLTGSPVCGNNVTNMSYAYFCCENLTGSPVCGNNVINMAGAYGVCTNLTGSPVCGNNVTRMEQAYEACVNLTGSPVCGNKVTDMSYAYRSCENLKGSPVCGSNVTDMSYAYSYCYNLTGSPVCGNKVTNMSWTYYGCNNVGRNAYFYSNSISNVANCFGGKNNSRKLNIYVHSGSTTYTTVCNNSTKSLVGNAITWSNQGTYQYNTSYNIYIYPVANVAAARAANGD